ncbi:phasin family protein [Stenotrophomonas sp. 278]|uniref:phasin family protein n=1 Tax=Stenotrophomonas sp. 278 TaxID=2479851 RepID=UPI000F68E6B2|nr:phasin family protein [Stenotrophomonas sp. 278]RRU11085.1 phasin family protein [Stenotrophomonas sp. 278]
MASAFTDSFSDYTRQLAAAATRANRLALENAESMFGVQLKTLEKNITATSGFFGEIVQSSEPGKLAPKGAQLVKDNLERWTTAHQEVFGLGLKATEALSELARQPFAARR